MLPSYQVRADLGLVNEEDRTVEVVWSTGSKGLRSGWDGPFYEELSMEPQHVNMERLSSGTAPVLAAHDSQSLDGVIGVVERAWLEKGQGKAVLRFSESDANADRAFKKIKERVLRNVSVGYSVQTYTEVSEKGAKVKTYRATKWEPQEISIVPIGFDMNATTRNTDNSTEVEIIEIVEESLTASSVDAEETRSMSAEVKDVAAAEAVVEQKPEVDAEQIALDAATQERGRISEISAAVRTANLDQKFAQDLIDRGVSFESASKEIFKKLKEQSDQMSVRSTVSVEITKDEKETTKEGLENFLLNRVNPKAALTENGKRFYGMSMVRMAEELLGGRPVGTSDIQLATRAMTSSDLPNILANVAEKSMRQEFALQAPSFQPWTKQGTLRNYKTNSRLMLGDFPSLEQVNEAGEVKFGSVAESKETIQLKRYLKAISFTKEMIINDDLNALSDFSTKAARAASRLESNLVYNDVLLANPTMGDGIALFHASHGNLGSAADISVASVGLGWAAMRKQLTLDGLEYADLTARYLIVGPDKETVARQFVSTALLAQQSSNINPFAGRLEVIVDSRIEGNAWYLSADPSQIDTIEIARLEGENGPMVTVEAGKVPGSSLITCEHSCGAAAMDFRGLYRNPGA